MNTSAGSMGAEVGKAHGTSAEAFLARQARNLREHLQQPARAETTAATGITAPGIAAEETHRAPLEARHA